MRREERHHLKDNPLATALTRVQSALLVQGRTLATAGAVVVVALAGVGGYFAWQQHQASQAGELLADALIVLDSRIAAAPGTEDDADESAAEWEQPSGTFATDEARLEAALERLTAVADAYPSLRPGIAARYEAAGALVALGRLDEAEAAYQQVIAAAGDQLHAAVARLGLAETRILGGDAAGAAELLEQETMAVESAVPLDAVLMRLGHAYELTGREGEALTAFTRVVEEFPLSIYASEARRKADALDFAASGTPISGS
jgi:tetratricopeptide (TPR) repeat protein